LSSATTRELVGRCLVAGGVERVVTAPVAGVSLPGPAKVIEGNPVLAALLADADGRIGPGPGACLSESLVLRVSSRPGGTAEPVAVTDPAEVPAAIAAAIAVAASPATGTAAVRLDLDLDAPVPDELGPLAPATPAVGPPPPIPAHPRTIVLAGPGVVRARAADGLRAFAAASGLGVANTWGAKGLFEWSSPHHLGTVGLQARDMALLGLGPEGVVITTGLDPDEARGADWGPGVTVVDVDPDQLAPLAATWDRPRAEIVATGYLDQMSAVCGPLREDTRFPLSPGRAVEDLRVTLAAAGPEALVAADPGSAGLWVARAFPTTVLGSVVVPAAAPPGFAAAAALVAGARRPRRPAVAVTTAPLDPLSRLAIDSARRLGAPLTLCVWGDPAEAGIEGSGVVEVTSLEHHAAALADALGRTGVRVLLVPVEWADIDRLVDVAGPPVAWPGIPVHGR
jgi:thiamine pyrophosphate-dependent acetolactate synthase large subunit-like protein